jgi:hypothetical protein
MTVHCLLGSVDGLLRLVGVQPSWGCAGFDSKPRGERIERSVGLHPGGVDVELAAPDQPGLLALLDNRLDELTKHLQAVAGANARQARMVGQRLVEVLAQVPAHTQPVGRQAHEEPFRAYPFEKHH